MTEPTTASPQPTDEQASAYAKFTGDDRRRINALAAQVDATPEQIAHLLLHEGMLPNANSTIPTEDAFCSIDGCGDWADQQRAGTRVCLRHFCELPASPATATCAWIGPHAWGPNCEKDTLPGDVLCQEHRETENAERRHIDAEKEAHKNGTCGGDCFWCVDAHRAPVSEF
jgi:hypothetical protein